MSHTHLTKTTLIFIKEYHAFALKGHEIARKLQRGYDVYRIIRQIKSGKTAIDIYLGYKENKQKCGRKAIQLPQDEIDYINKKVTEGWTLDVIIDCKERHISCGMKTLYRMFEKDVFNQEHLHIKGKRKLMVI